MKWPTAVAHAARYQTLLWPPRLLKPYLQTRGPLGCTNGAGTRMDRVGRPNKESEGNKKKKSNDKKVKYETTSGEVRGGGGNVRYEAMMRDALVPLVCLAPHSLFRGPSVPGMKLLRRPHSWLTQSATGPLSRPCNGQPGAPIASSRPLGVPSQTALRCPPVHPQGRPVHTSAKQGPRRAIPEQRKAP